MRPDSACRLTKHCLMVPCQDGRLLYHTLTGELVLLEQGEELDACRDQLVPGWFLVPEDFDECARADQVRKIAALLKTEKRKKHFTVLTTTDCNARCFYCYELGIPRHAMSEETARDVGEYIAQACGGEPVKLSWFGGEPLYNCRAIDIICSVLRERGIEYSSILTSNAYFLDEETAGKAACDWHIRHAQITVDGTEQVYNRTKAYINHTQGSPYQRVLENISHALDAGIEVSVRLNMDSANAEDLMVLAEELAVRFKGRRNLYAHVILLQPLTHAVHQFASQERAFACKKALEEKLKASGMYKPFQLKRDLHINQCMADNDACEVILPDGRIQNCEHYDEAEIIGSIYSDARNEEIRRTWKETVRFPACKDCALYPNCISLRRCAWWQNGCSDYGRKARLERYEEGIIAAYRREIARSKAEHGES